jgi:hypothetical protein
MKTVSERLKLRRNKDLVDTPVTINMPADVVEDLKEIAALRGYSRFEALVRSYVGHGLRRDLDRFHGAPVQRLAESLRKQGLGDDAIAAVLAETSLSLHEPMAPLQASEAG